MPSRDAAPSRDGWAAVRLPTARGAPTVGTMSFLLVIRQLSGTSALNSSTNLTLPTRGAPYVYMATLCACLTGPLPGIRSRRRGREPHQ
eukprot:361881-Chlamydomonas_euryale.AAC.2